MDLRRNLLAMYTLWHRDMVRFVRDRSQLFSSLGQPLFFLLIFGVGVGAIVPDLPGAVSFAQFLFPGILALTILYAAVFSAISVVIDRQAGFLKDAMVAPVSRAALVLGKTAGGATIAWGQGMLVMLLAPILGFALSWGQVLLLVVLQAIVAAAMTGLGILMAARQRTIAGFHMMMNLVLLPLFFLSGAFYPLGSVPGWMRALAVLDPVTYAVDALRWTLLASTAPEARLQELTLFPLWLSVTVVVLCGTLFLTASVWLFAREESALG